MATHYYYFIAGLPDLILDDRRRPISFSDFMTEAADAVSLNDRDLLQCIRLPIDNENVLTTLEEKNVPFDGRGSLSREEVIAGCKGKELFPDYLNRFVRGYRDNTPLVQGYSWADQLAWLFYAEMADTDNAFLREWFLFECNLRNLLAACTLRKNLEHLMERFSGIAVPPAIIGDNAVAQSLRRSRAPDFGLAGKLSWAEHLLELQKKKPLEQEKRIDMLRWDVLDELLPVDFFRIETILACGLKLLFVERWQVLGSENGMRAYKRLVGDLTGHFSISAKG